MLPPKGQNYSLRSMRASFHSQALSAFSESNSYYGLVQQREKKYSPTKSAQRAAISTALKATFCSRKVMLSTCNCAPKTSAFNKDYLDAPPKSPASEKSFIKKISCDALSHY